MDIYNPSPSLSPHTLTKPVIVVHSYKHPLSFC